MTKKTTPTHEQRLAGAFVEANASASMLLEMLDALRAPESLDSNRLESLVSHMELMVQRMGYVNQVAAHLACPGLLDAPIWSNWMREPAACEFLPVGNSTVKG